MENKYFIPEISDFYNGYEYERNDGGEWYSVTCDLYDARDIKTLLNKKVLDTFPEGKNPLDSDTYSAHYRATSIDRIRVPHLTKEQIEAEGWELIQIYPKGACIFQKGTKEKGCELTYDFTEHRVHFTKLYFYGLDDEYTRTKLTWSSLECKDINTFRKIIKLLGI
jgi:hypothetical protein